MKNQRLKDQFAETAVSLDHFEDFSNELAMDDQGWQVIPFGEWAHNDGLQRFGPSSAAKILGYFKNGYNKLKRCIVGLPIFNGHPDQAPWLREKLANERDETKRANLKARIAQLESKYTDEENYGAVADMEVRPNGLAIKLALANGGDNLVRSGKDRVSPWWLADRVGTTPSGKPIFEPCMLMSIALTDRPVIPNASLANAKINKPMNPETLKLLGLAADATDEQVAAAVTALKNRPEASALANEKTAREAAVGAQTAIKTELDTAKKSLTDAQAALANERKAHVKTHVDTAVRLGKITPAEQETWTARLIGNFTAESVALANEKSKVKMETVTGALAEVDQALKARLANGGEPDGDECGNVAAKIVEAVKAEKEKPAMQKMSPADRHKAAFANVQKAHPRWFASK